jgi:hypothetical protein
VAIFAQGNFMNIEDKIAIQELNYRYALHIDLTQTEQWVNIFTPDGILDEREFGFGVHSGHDGIRKYALDLASHVIHQVHLMTNHLISEVSPTQATGTVFALVEGMTRTLGHNRFHVYYEDEYVKHDKVWKFKKRVLHKTFPPEVVSKLA